MESDLSPSELVANTIEDELTAADLSHLKLLAVLHIVAAVLSFVVGGVAIVVISSSMETIGSYSEEERLVADAIHEEMQEDVLYGDEGPPPTVVNDRAQQPVRADALAQELVTAILAGSLAVVIVFVACVMAILQLLVARCLQKRNCWVFCQVVAGIECLLIPAGTVLGVLTIVVLQRASVVAFFKRAPGPQETATDEDQA